MITAIVEDELPNSTALKLMLKEYCPAIKSMEVFDSLQTAIDGINKLKPDLIFLDIMLGNQNGFDLIEFLPQPAPKIIFTTAYDAYALRAFKVSAVDYLLKPINIKELQIAVHKASNAINNNSDQQKSLQTIKSNIYSGNGRLNKLALPTMEGHIFTELDNVVRFEASGSYTNVYLISKEKIMVSRQLKEYEHLLEHENFFRTHHAHLVNLKHIKKYVKGKGGYLVMSDGGTADVAMRRKEDLLKVLNIH